MRRGNVRRRWGGQRFEDMLGTMGTSKVPRERERETERDGASSAPHRVAGKETHLVPRRDNAWGELAGLLTERYDLPRGERHARPDHGVWPDRRLGTVACGAEGEGERGGESRGGRHEGEDEH